MDKTKTIFWKHFQGFEKAGTDKQTFSILYDAAIAEIAKTDTIFNRIKKFNQLVEPQLLELDDREKVLAEVFLLGYLKKYLSIKQIEEVSDQLSTFIERDLS